MDSWIKKIVIDGKTELLYDPRDLSAVMKIMYLEEFILSQDEYIPCSSNEGSRIDLMVKIIPKFSS